MSSDEAIQLTNNDATTFKAYAISKGYWHDPYISYFAGSKQQQQQCVYHKPPEMSLGYFARVKAVRTIVDKFLNKYSTDRLESGELKCQILNLGCGYDTLFFNLIDQNKIPFKYVEIDFQRITMSKIRTIKLKKVLVDKLLKTSNEATSSSSNDSSEFKIPALFTTVSTSLPPGLQSNSEIHLKNYHLISSDLRNTKDLEKKLHECNLDPNLPTLVLAECVLIYMNKEHSNKLLKFLTQTFRSCCFINYEQVNLNDKFGEIMLTNMQMRECKLLGTDACGSIDSQFNRFVENGFDINNCQILTMTDYYNNKLDEHERKRVESLEFLDEKELLFQLLDHYCICITSNSQELKFVLF
jgi:[phosphatase 2A protein]-leucine-carboxy methyltransferase